MIRALIDAAKTMMPVRVVVAGVGAAVEHTGHVLLTWADVMVIPAEAIDADDDEGEAIMPGAEAWLTGLKIYHAEDAYTDTGDNCGNADCRTCWINATGAADR